MKHKKHKQSKNLDIECLQGSLSEIRDFLDDLIEEYGPDATIYIDKFIGSDYGYGGERVNVAVVEATLNYEPT